MKLAGRILIALFAASVSALLAPLGCGVDNDDRLPGLPNELPNGPSIRSSGAGGSGTGGSSTGSGAQNVCECAVTAFASDTNPCATCISDTGGGACTNEYSACTMNGACTLLLTTLAGCKGDATCITDALATQAGADVYIKLLKCACSASQCSTQCAPAKPITCNLTGDAGAGDGGNASDASSATDADPDAADAAGG